MNKSNPNSASSATASIHDESSVRNGWIIRLDNDVRTGDYTLTINHKFAGVQGVGEGDGIVIVSPVDGLEAVVGFARLYRKRLTVDQATLYFDGLIVLEPGVPLDELGIPPTAATSIVARLDWPVFEQALNKATGISYSSFPPLAWETPREQAYIRELLQDAVMDDLLGPADGPYEEIIGMSVRDRYLVGKLAPQHTLVEEEDDLCGEEGSVDPEEPGREIDASTNQSLVPSSLGFTFCVDEAADQLEVRASWGRYERGDSERTDEKTRKPFRAWKRIPSGGSMLVSLSEKKIDAVVVDPDCPHVVVQGSVSEALPNGDRLVTLFLVNTQEMPDQNQDQAWVFQPELIVRDSENRPMFRRRPVVNESGEDPERESLEMIYRKRVEFAVGHGVSVHAKPAEEDYERAVEIRTSVMPQYEVPVTETPGLDERDRPALRDLIASGSLDMQKLAEMDRADLVPVLTMLTDDYSNWIQEQQGRICNDVSSFDDVATAAVQRCKQVLERLQEGIRVLDSDDRALEAFRFANLAMALQRVRSIYSLRRRRGEDISLDALDVPKNRSWRPFQVAFILLSIPALADPTHRDRTEPLEAYADLLWFPTGGGKTEAYLGVAAFTMAIRRLQGEIGGFDGSRGLAVIMRYTLRLLTVQQFQRATALICAMEVLRRADAKTWGKEPFTIGLWVGQRVTPNTTEERHKAIENERDRRHGSASTPAQLTSCPWCGAEIAPGRDITVDREVGRTFVYCGDKHGQCDFSRARSKNLGLPLLVVDEEIYHRPPSMLIATVDKFVMMAWRGEVRTLFGKATQECPRHGLLWPESECTGNHQKRGALDRATVQSIKPLRPPDLIIQDEFHLISGPLGTMVGLYETAVDELCSWALDGKTVRPKIVASTATVRKADEQINNVFLRRVAVFPPHGLDVEDNFFSVQRPTSEKPGRRYLGICSLGNSRPAVLIRVYVAFLTAAQALFDRLGPAADPYMTLIGYFNSKRELGGMRRLSEDDVQTRAYRVQMSNVIRPGLAQRSIRNVDEMTARVSSKDIPQKLDQLEVKFKQTWAKGETRAVDVMLATNMFSVGVDINRLGLMVVNGHGKSRTNQRRTAPRP